MTKSIFTLTSLSLGVRASGRRKTLTQMYMYFCLKIVLIMLELGVGKVFFHYNANIDNIKIYFLMVCVSDKLALNL